MKKFLFKAVTALAEKAISVFNPQFVMAKLDGKVEAATRTITEHMEGAPARMPAPAAITTPPQTPTFVAPVRDKKPWKWHQFVVMIMYVIALIGAVTSSILVFKHHTQLGAYIMCGAGALAVIAAVFDILNHYRSKAEAAAKEVEETAEAAVQKFRTFSKFFFTNDGKFNVIYFWTTLFMTTVFAIVVMKLVIVIEALITMKKANAMDYAALTGLLSDTLVLGLLAFIASFVFVYNRYKINATSIDQAQPDQTGTEGGTK